MWFSLSLLALSMLVSRRSVEKHVAGKISPLGMTWIQQAVALPFIIATLFFAKFYMPAELSTGFWLWMALYVACISLDIFCYFKALSLADVSFVAPIMTLISVGNIAGAYVVLGQVPTVYGVMGAVLIVAGAVLTYVAKHRYHDTDRHANKLAVLFLAVLLVERSIGSNIEVFMLRESNPTTFNFYSSVLVVPFMLFITSLIITTSRNGKYTGYWRKLKGQVYGHKLLLAFIGITYTVNMLATYQAKLIGPNAGYVGAVKSASVLPMMLIGVFLFKEKVVKAQWAGLVLILVGLSLLALN